MTDERLPDPTTERERRLVDALSYAILVIRNYEADIRGSEWTGVDLQAKGFCQGTIYRDAISSIIQRAHGGTT